MHTHETGHRHGNQLGLALALAITSILLAVEFVGGIITNSLALLSDSGHMLSDAGSLLLSLIAMRLAVRPPSSHKTFGYQRFEIIAAFINGVTLIAIAALIIFEACSRFAEPPVVESGLMLWIAVLGLAANMICAWILLRKGDVKDNLNIRSAYLHVLGDALGSAGAIVAGLLMYFWGWYVADPIISIIVAALILRSAGHLVSQSAHILMEGTPPGIDTKQIKASLGRIEGVRNIHDLHVWTLTSGTHSFSCHLLIAHVESSQVILSRASDIVRGEFGFHFSTIQTEVSADCRCAKV